MNRRHLFSLVFLCAVMVVICCRDVAADALHTPKQGSAEWRSILKAVQGSPVHRYKVHYLKVHNGWAWIDVTPLDVHGAPGAEGGPQLLHRKAGGWITVDFSKVPDDPDDPMGPEDASAVFVKNLRKRFPGVPKDIFPKPTH